jgi:hypothetical protein
MIEFREDTHEYFLDGRKLISVTQLMRKHGLAPSYDAVPSAVLKAKAERGTLIHKEIEKYIKYGEIGFIPQETLHCPIKTNILCHTYLSFPNICFYILFHICPIL